MLLMEERTSENEGTEKHVPVAEQEGSKLTVKVGSVEHPMTKEHYIEWIEVQEDNGKVQRKFLSPEDKPVAEFELTGKPVVIREYITFTDCGKLKYSAGHFSEGSGLDLTETGCTSDLDDKPSRIRMFHAKASSPLTEAFPLLCFVFSLVVGVLALIVFATLPQIS